MSHGKIREEKNCLNCNHHVEEKFCPNCGQENTETRQPFYFLFTHFIEDFTHYDGQFWKTIKLLLFKPGKLTKEYLSGQRQLHVPPVKLYIFVSFFTFFIFSLLPSYNTMLEEENPNDLTKIERSKSVEAIHNLRKQGLITKEKSFELLNELDADEIDEKQSNDKNNKVTVNIDNTNVKDIKNIEQYEEVTKNKSHLLSSIGKPFAKKYFELKQQGLSPEEISERLSDTFMHTLPKALFIYLPFFALMLYLFHDRKKFWYFDHGVFTLHYFSFFLIVVFFLNVFDTIEDYAMNTFVSVLYGITFTISFFYLIIYFFIASHRVYQTGRKKTILKGVGLFILNSIFLVVLLLALVAISFLMIH